ncbi:MAG: DUF1570 domain-containing protein [Planctomycetes bacterium]|nr:DUF1570 domain-containing protein [Planctomycetota bacterium]
MRRLAALAFLAVLALPRPVAALPEEGPHFAIPDGWDAATVELYRGAVALFEEARDAERDSVAKMERAIRELMKVLRQEGSYAPVRYYLGYAYQITREFNKARVQLDRSLEIQPDFHEAMVELADTYVHLGQPERAGPVYDRAVETAPDYVHGHENRAVFRLREGVLDGALEDARRVLEAEPENATMVYVRDLVQRERDGEGWSETFTAETEHYVVRTSTDQAFADFIALRAELIHKLYTRIFPKVPGGTRKFPIVVHAGEAEYHAAGGPPSAGGHYEPLIRKLVLYRYPREEDTLLVLQHEGFHQFLHYYLDDAPQWFNEGVADFFGPSRHVRTERRGEVVREGMEIRTNPWRLELIQRAVTSGRVRRFRDLMLMSQAELYDREWAGIHYAQSWSIIYFLCEWQDRKYFPILKRYFQVLREGDGQEEAFAKSFGKVDLEALEAEWRRCVLALEG